MTNVFWIKHSRRPHLAIVARPRGEDWLEDDLKALKASGIDILVSLLEPDEAEYLGLGKERELAENAGMEFISFPIPDHATPPDPQSFCRLIFILTEAIRDGKKVGTHCQGCIGRATMTAAAVLMELGWHANDVLPLIEVARGCSVPDTEEQRRWILHFTPCSQKTR
jgi:protein-tyrosine phosphatase